jgi:hypothetical protein
MRQDSDVEMLQNKGFDRNFLSPTSLKNLTRRASPSLPGNYHPWRKLRPAVQKQIPARYVGI